MICTAPHTRFVEEVPERHGQELGEPGGECVKQEARTGAIGKAHQRMTQLVCRPLGAVAGVKTRDNQIMPERLILGFFEHTAHESPARVGLPVGPGWRCGQREPMLEMAQKQA